MSKQGKSKYAAKGRGDSYGTWKDGVQRSAETLAGRKVEKLIRS